MDRSFELGIQQLPFIERKDLSFTTSWGILFSRRLFECISFPILKGRILKIQELIIDYLRNLTILPIFINHFIILEWDWIVLVKISMKSY